jgi:hypothetical protein
MTRQTLRISPVLLIAAACAALLSWGCPVETPGVGVGMDYPARWGGGNTGPPVFVGGPSN